MDKRGVYAWSSGTGLMGVITDIGKGIVIDYSKRKLAAACINASSYVLSPAVVMFTNASKYKKKHYFLVIAFGSQFIILCHRLLATFTCLLVAYFWPR